MNGPPPVHHAARLALEDGSVFTGEPFGAVGRGITQTAEVVFNTAMTGYQEALTDPSYWGQILVMTAPQIGNTGVNAEDTESARVQVSGFVVRELSRVHSNFRATRALPEFLAEHGVLGISGVDTRALTRRLRSSGVMRGVITDDPTDRLSDSQLVESARRAADMSGRNLVPNVGCSSPQTWTETLADWSPGTPAAGGSRKHRVLALDCGAKRNILRHLSERGCEVHVVPHTITAEEVSGAFSRGEADGLFISNGPGDPAAVEATIATLRTILNSTRSASIPTFGICLGHQLLSLALGAKSYKLKFGHRGLNQPVLNLITGRVEITSQNHGFAVDLDSLAAGVKAGGGGGGGVRGGVLATHINLNDRTLAGFALTDRPVFAVQHHPEASPGPHDAGYLFDAFVAMMGDRRPVSLEAFRVRALGSSVALVGAAPAPGTIPG